MTTSSGVADSTPARGVPGATILNPDRKEMRAQRIAFSDMNDSSATFAASQDGCAGVALMDLDELATVRQENKAWRTPTHLEADSEMFSLVHLKEVQEVGSTLAAWFRCQAFRGPSQHEVSSEQPSWAPTPSVVHRRPGRVALWLRGL
jgi:hypothetical protein